MRLGSMWLYSHGILWLARPADHPRSLTCTFNCVYIMLAVDDQRTLLGKTGHNIRSWHWMGMCESVSDSPESLCLCNPRPRRPSDPWTKASQLFADKSQDAGETIKTNWEASNNKQWVNDFNYPARSRSPVNFYSLVRVQKISIPWSQHSVRFTNIREHCVSWPWALRNCQNPCDSRVIRETWQVCLMCVWRSRFVFLDVAHPALQSSVNTVPSYRDGEFAGHNEHVKHGIYGNYKQI